MKDLSIMEFGREEAECEPLFKAMEISVIRVMPFKDLSAEVLPLGKEVDWQSSAIHPRVVMGQLVNP